MSLPSRWTAKAIFAALGILAGGNLAGCKIIEQAQDPSYNRGPFRTQYNFALAPGAETNALRRLAVLPLHGGEPGANESLEHGRLTLQPLLLESLRQSHRFEVVSYPGIPPARLEGASSFRVTDTLPHDAWTRLAQESGADAVLFSQLTAYQGYPPLLLGLKLTLVRMVDGQVLWEFDDVFNAGEPATKNSARRYFRDQAGLDSTLDGTSLVLNSPRRFSLYALGSAFSTLPQSWLK